MLNCDGQKHLARGRVFEQIPWSIPHLESFGDKCSKDSGTWSSPLLPECGAGPRPLTRLPRQHLTTVLQIPAFVDSSTDSHTWNHMSRHLESLGIWSPSSESTPGVTWNRSLIIEIMELPRIWSPSSGVDTWSHLEYGVHHLSRHLESPSL